MYLLSVRFVLLNVADLDTLPVLLRWMSTSTLYWAAFEAWTQYTLRLQVFMLSADAILNIDTLSELLASGHSRVPVHVPGNR